MLEDFLQHLQFEKRYSPHTISSYRIDLDQYRIFLMENYDGIAITESTHPVIRSWMVSMIENGLTPRTVNRKISSLKSFFKWAKKYRSHNSDPTNQLKLPKVSKRLPVYVEEDQMTELGTANFFDDDFEGLRNRLIIELFYQTGIRCSELIHLKLGNIDTQRQTIKVLGKRNKERIIPVGDDVLGLMKQYLEVRPSPVDPESNTLIFLTHKGLKLYPKLVYRVVNTYLGKVSALRKKSPHVLRHTFATHMLNRGADLNAIKELLGHSSLAATQVYTHNSIEKLKEIHRNAHPKG
ncbi:MAG TPA: tyrosine-type recombinase/integrase [Cryomorphaceae bacterium]|nr:tyrosine-type recombinase/integrase [Cryomorphaceae bacterium]